MFGRKKNKNITYQKHGTRLEQIHKPLLEILAASENKVIPNAELYSFVYACVATRAEVLSSGEVYLYRKQVNKITEASDVDLEVLLNKQNLLGQTFQQLLYFIAGNLDLYGNCYVRIIFNGNKQPVDLIPLITKSVSVEYVSIGGINLIKNYKYSDGGEYMTLMPEEMLHFKVPNLKNPLEGKPTIDPLKNWIDIDYLQTQYIKNFFTHDATPHTVLETDKDISKQTADELEEKWIDKFRGIFNKFRPVVLKNGLKVNTIQSNPKENDTINTQKLTVDRVLSVLKVPKPVMAITEQVNYANANAGLKTFIDNTIKPFAKLCIESTLTEFARKYFNYKYIVKLDYSFNYDLEIQLKEFDIALRHGLYTRNEIRELRGFGRSEDPIADILLIPAQTSSKAEENKDNQNTDETNKTQ